MFHFFFDGSCILNQGAFLLEHRRRADLPLVVGQGAVDAAGYVNNVGVAIQRFGVLNALCKVVALGQLGCADTELDRESLAACLVDLIADHDGKLCAVLAAAAPLIGPLVGVLAEELLRQPAVSAVNGDHVESFIFSVDR